MKKQHEQRARDYRDRIEATGDLLKRHPPKGSLAVKCPECGSPPGFACTSDRARNELGVLKRDHSARREAAKAAAATTTTEAIAN